MLQETFGGVPVDGAADDETPRKLTPTDRTALPVGRSIEAPPPLDPTTGAGGTPSLPAPPILTPPPIAQAPTTAPPKAPFDPYGYDELQAAASGTTTANDAAHLQAAGTMTSQGADPFGRFVPAGSPAGASATNTYSPLEAQSPEAQRAYWTKMQMDTAAATGTPLNESPNIDYVGSYDPALASKTEADVRAGQAKSTAAIGTGFVDPAIRSQFFNSDGSAKNPAAAGSPSLTGPESRTDANPWGGGILTEGTGGMSRPSVLRPQSPAFSPQLLHSLLAQLPGGGASGASAKPSIGGPANPDAGDAAPMTSANVTGIDPLADLRNKMITPGTDDLTEKARQGMADAQSNLSSFDRGKTLTDAINQFSQADPRRAQIQSMVDEATKSLNGVDRVKLAQDMFKTFADSTAPEYDLAMKKATQRAAAAGGLGGGNLRTQYGDLALSRSRDLDTKKQELVQQAISDSVNDAMNKQQRLAALEGQVTGENNADRGFAADFTNSKSGDLQAALSGASGVFGQTANEENRRRDELRTERGYQTGQEESAFNRALTQYQTEQAAQRDRFNQGLAMLNTGSAGNPASILTALSQMGLDPSMLAKLAASSGQRAA